MAKTTNVKVREWGSKARKADDRRFLRRDQRAAIAEGLEDATVTLTGKTKKGKERVKRSGKLWRVTDQRDHVVFSKETGPWLHVMAGSDVHATNDENFTVEEWD